MVCKCDPWTGRRFLQLDKWTKVRGRGVESVGGFWLRGRGLLIEGGGGGTLLIDSGGGGGGGCCPRGDSFLVLVQTVFVKIGFLLIWASLSLMFSLNCYFLTAKCAILILIFSLWADVGCFKPTELNSMKIFSQLRQVMVLKIWWSNQCNHTQFRETKIENMYVKRFHFLDKSEENKLATNQKIDSVKWTFLLSNLLKNLCCYLILPRQKK